MFFHVDFSFLSFHSSPTAAAGILTAVSQIPYCSWQHNLTYDMLRNRCFSSHPPFLSYLWSRIMRYSAALVWSTVIKQPGKMTLAQQTVSLNYYERWWWENTSALKGENGLFSVKSSFLLNSPTHQQSVCQCTQQFVGHTEGSSLCLEAVTHLPWWMYLPKDCSHNEGFMSCDYWGFVVCSFFFPPLLIFSKMEQNNIVFPAVSSVQDVD